MTIYEVSNTLFPTKKLRDFPHLLLIGYAAKNDFIKMQYLKTGKIVSSYVRLNK